MSGRQEATRSRLLEATLEVLRSHGVAQTTSREIAAAAGVNLQAITYHFGSKDDLVAQALVHAVRTWVEPARTALTGIAGDPVGGLLAAMAALQQAMGQAHEHFPAYIEALATASRDEAVRGQIVELLAELRAAVAASIRELREAGYIASWVSRSRWPRSSSRPATGSCCTRRWTRRATPPDRRWTRWSSYCSPPPLRRHGTVCSNMTTSRSYGTVFTDHTFTVPLDHDRPDDQQIQVYAREVRAAGRSGHDLPWLLFLGGEGWLQRALRDFRVLLLDQVSPGRRQEHRALRPLPRRRQPAPAPSPRRPLHPRDRTIGCPALRPFRQAT